MGALKRDKDKKKKSKDQRKRAFQAMRIGDLNKLFAKRNRGTREDYVFPDDDAGIDDLRILLGHYAYSNPQRLTKVAALRAPWLTGTQFDYMMADATPRMWTFQELGDHMNLTEAERCDLGIRTIGTIDVTSKQRKQARKVRDKDRKAAARLAKGATPREQSKSRLKPWDLDGISRATWYRRQRETNSSTVNLVIAADAVVSRHTNQDGPDNTRLIAKHDIKPATSAAEPKKEQTLEMSEARHDESVLPEIQKKAA